MGEHASPVMPLLEIQQQQATGKQGILIPASSLYYNQAASHKPLCTASGRCPEMRELLLHLPDYITAREDEVPQQPVATTEQCTYAHIPGLHTSRADRLLWTGVIFNLCLVENGLLLI
ncbi:hypothetical protein Vafri_7344 [Volvox africanus]|uniref:Uncharacterized protein n=1 Tax=Volvox africanus TaxID=51714 RepID=A0A8J4B0P9_9CHLO|nr:hypothetical protein Vafri_7344 [Volvox africanus]